MPQNVWDFTIGYQVMKKRFSYREHDLLGRPLTPDMAKPCRVMLYDVDGRIPNLALMKLSSHYRARGCAVELVRVRGSRPPRLRADADLHFASAIFYRDQSVRRLGWLRSQYGKRLEAGGSGCSLQKRLPPEVEACFPDYSLYGHHQYALGFLTRGCKKRCPFCLVPAKEGRGIRRVAHFENFVPAGQDRVLLLDDNLLAYDGVEPLLEEMARRRYAVNFSQTLDIAWLDETKHRLLLEVDSRNLAFNKRMYYFSLNHPNANRLFEERRAMLKSYGEGHVGVVCLYGFDTTLSQDYQRWRCLRRLGLIPFFQQYWPIQGVPSRLAGDFFDMDFNEVIRLTFRSNGFNWEKYLRWLNRRYFARFGRYYRPLIEIIYRYNNKERIAKYLRRPELLTTEMYRDFREDG